MDKRLSEGGASAARLGSFEGAGVERDRPTLEAQMERAAEKAHTLDKIISELDGALNRLATQAPRAVHERPSRLEGAMNQARPTLEYRLNEHGSHLANLVENANHLLARLNNLI